MTTRKHLRRYRPFAQTDYYWRRIEEDFESRQQLTWPQRLAILGAALIFLGLAYTWLVAGFQADKIVRGWWG